MRQPCRHCCCSYVLCGKIFIIVGEVDIFIHTNVFISSSLVADKISNISFAEDNKIKMLHKNAAVHRAMYICYHKTL